jgi:hypothetical protein
LGTKAASRKFRVLNRRQAAEGIHRNDFYPFLAFVKRAHMNYSGIHLTIDQQGRCVNQKGRNRGGKGNRQNSRKHNTTKHNKTQQNTTKRPGEWHESTLQINSNQSALTT